MDKTAIKIISYFDDIEEFLIGILFFTLPFGWTASIIPLVLFATMLVINIITKPQKPNKEKIRYFLPIMGLIVWELVSLIYSHNPSNGISTIGTQSILFVLPFAFLFNNIKQKTILKALYMFLLGCTSAIIFLFSLGLYRSSSIIGDAFVFRPFFNYSEPQLMDTDISGHYFLGNTFSSLIHPAYMALMLGIAMFIILSHLKLDSTWLKQKTAWLIIFTLIGISIIAMSLNSSLVLIVFTILIILGLMSTKGLHYGELSRGIYFSVLVFIMLLILNPQANTITNGPEQSNSLQKRGVVSQAALHSLKGHWFLGFGIGSEKQVIKQQLENSNEHDLAQRTPNAHNQFLSTWIQSGLPGLALLLSCFYVLYLRAKRKKSLLVLAFGSLVFLSFLFESMLNRYWGALTFALFYGVFFFYSNNVFSEKEKNS